MSKVKLQTNHGESRIELDADKAPVTVKNFLDYVQRLLREHHLPPRDPRLHDPGRRLRARHEAEADQGADQERSRTTA